ncbi:hypothetical protein SAMN05421542_3428 [Chryseobacterium jejuense]|uniref:Uncharacterized protein n=1 Tax=Chryseobacterium jejuense TaxID=445960 RepID=A0A2X2WYZ2_CHRJE|nr:hypothetical protein SAMN05421542_3428 [Chryseobacterium jejuense]SQB45928.1 Uncharacterised protein [Chryseobacterium jejuense]
MLSLDKRNKYNIKTTAFTVVLFYLIQAKGFVSVFFVSAKSGDFAQLW